MTRRPSTAFRRRLRTSLVVAGIGWALATHAGPRPGPTEGAEPQLAPPESGVEPSAISWQEIERLTSEGKAQAALAIAEPFLAQARQASDDVGWARALVTVVQLRMALHGYETAVRSLRQEAWPPSLEPSAVLELFYAHSLATYAAVYSWEIAQRERVVSRDEVDLKAWTRAQIYAEAQAAFHRVWQRRAAWEDRSTSALSELLEPNDYPARVRGTFRDAVTYLWVELLADSSLWSPQETNGLFRLPLRELIEGGPAEAVADPDVHPLQRLAALLADLEAWHRAGGRPEAAFEARRERLERLSTSFTDPADQEVIRTGLTGSIERLGRRHPWWSMGMASLAELWRRSDAPEALVEARRVALAGAEAHPESLGGRRCRHLVGAIEAPHFALQAMSSDGRDRRSIAVEHRNLARLHFRAYAVDLRARIEGSQDYNLLPTHREIADLVERRTPTAEWTVDLPETPDYREHRTYVTPPLPLPGLYVVAASARRDFAEAHNLRSAVDLIVGDLVLVTRQRGGAYEVTARSGASARPLPRVLIDLYRYDWRRGHRAIRRHTTGADGTATIPIPTAREPYFLLAEHGGAVALDADQLWRMPRPPSAPQTAALIYTDRSIYRPRQELLWKVVAYRGGDENVRFRTLPETDLRVDLVDPNGEVAATAEVTTNDFGSAAGAFTVPPGRLLGSWVLRTTLGGEARVRVEEYKRPTFEVTWRDAEEPVRLNRPATLTGEVRYYFGLPVVSGNVRWVVRREPIYPRWWWWSGDPGGGVETIAGGDSRLDADGRFSVTFTPEADERDAASGISYSFRLEAEATDEGGETRSASRSFRLGFVAVEADVEPRERFVVAGEPLEATVLRKDLDGAPRSGRGAWRLLALEQPPATRLPAEQPLPAPPDGRYRTPGDRLRPRWERSYSVEAVLASWEDGEEVAAGELVHGDDGLAELAVEALPPGAYRLRYSTRDAFGALFETAREVLVAKAGETPLALPAVLIAQDAALEVGETARLLVHSGLDDQPLQLEIFRRSERIERRFLSSRKGLQIIEIPIGEDDRGGFGVTLTALRDHQLMILQERVFVPWDDRELKVAFTTFRDRLRPGDEETWRVTVTGADGAAVEAGAAELLAYMYDRSLDLFAPHLPPRPLSLYPDLTGTPHPRDSLGWGGESWRHESQMVVMPPYPGLRGDRLKSLPGYGLGGPGRQRLMAATAMARPAPAPEEAMWVTSKAEVAAGGASIEETVSSIPEPAAPPPEARSAPGDALRTDFSETAFWHPQLLLGEDGSVTFELTVPDSVTEWNVWVHALTRDLRAGSLERRARSVKELLVRPYLPRFLREGDRAEVRVVVNNAGEVPLSGHLRLTLVAPEGGEDLGAAFGLGPEAGPGRPFKVEPGSGTALAFAIQVPPGLGTVAFRAVATAGDRSDGELRPLPVLPGRMHLAQSRFAALHGDDRRALHFADLAEDDDPTRLHDQLVVTLDGQLFATVLGALPYLIDFPYECTEQTLNRFVSTAIVWRVFADYPAVARMARELSQRPTQLETWADDDPNRRMALVETPWLSSAHGGSDRDLIEVLDPRVARAQRDAALAALGQAQTSLGGFPWWPGGPPSPYMTLLLLSGLSKVIELDVEVPRELVERAWRYLHRHYVDELVRGAVAKDCCWEMVTFLNYVLSGYPDDRWTGGVFTEAERRAMLELSFRHWREHPPLLKAQLALTLQRAGRAADAALVFDSLMDSARSDPDLGTYWAPEDRGWLWYNDTVEGHAFALRALTELDPDDERRHGLVQWLLTNKKLNHWKSTRSTAEVIDALVRYLEREGALGVHEAASVTVGPLRRTFTFEPDALGERQLLIPGPQLEPRTMATVTVEKETPGFLFASATWHFSTERLPEEARGDLFALERAYFRRVHDGREWTLAPLLDGTPLELGDQVEVHLSVRARHAAEYVHLRDPRGAGFEPETHVSQHRWELGIGWYEEVRDSGTSFFFERLPAGQHSLKTRLRAATAGTFRVGPATLQSMYAPEFTAYSAGAHLEVASRAED